MAAYRRPSLSSITGCMPASAMMMVRISIPDDHPPVISDSPALARLRASEEMVEVVVWDSRPASEEEVLQRIEGAHTVINIRSSSRFTRHVLEGAPDLKHIAIWGTGTDNVDLDAARREGITVTNTPNTATVAVAEHCLALLLALARRVPELDARVRRGEWPRGLLTQLAGKTLGVIGTGAIGMRVAEIARGIGMKVIAWTRHPDHGWARAHGVTYLEFEGVLREADVVSLHLRLTDETTGVLGADQLALMKPTALLVNVARGGLVDEVALVEALRAGTIAGVALDTFAEEPIGQGSPLRSLPNAILSPHTAGTTAEALANGLEMVVDNVLDFLSGSVQHRVA